MAFDHDPELTPDQSRRGLAWIFMLALSLLVLSWAAGVVWDSLASAQGEGGFVCEQPYIHDGDNIRCTGVKGRLYGIDAPEMPGACRPGRQCTPGDPYASRDHLRGLIAGRTVHCRQLDTDRYGRSILRCETDGVDLSCSQVAAGFAVKRYGQLQCDSPN